MQPPHGAVRPSGPSSEWSTLGPGYIVRVPDPARLGGGGGEPIGAGLSCPLLVVGRHEAHQPVDPDHAAQARGEGKRV